MSDADRNTIESDEGLDPPVRPVAANEIRTQFLDSVRSGGLTNPFALAVVDAFAQQESTYARGNLARDWEDKSESGQPGRSGGIMSYRNERLQALRQFAGDRINDPRAHGEFFVKERPAMIQQLQNARSLEEAHQIMGQNWQYAGWNRSGGENAKRLGIARQRVHEFQRPTTPPPGYGAAVPANPASAGQRASLEPQNFAQLSGIPDDPRYDEEDEFPPLQPTFFANAGGAIPDDQGRTTFSAQAPNAQGSVFLQHETQQPQQQQARRIQFPAQQPQQQRQAIPTGPSTADRFRDMRAGHAQRRADAEAARAAAAQQQPAQQQARFTDDEFESRMWLREQQNSGSGWHQVLTDIHHQHGGLRSDPSGSYLVQPPQREGWLITSGPEWEAYKQLPTAPQDMVTKAFDRWRFSGGGGGAYGGGGEPGGGVANAGFGGDPAVGHGTSTDW